MIDFSVPLQGMAAAEDLFSHAAAKLAQAIGDPADPTTGDTVDLSAGLVSLLEARNNFATNVKVARVADEMARSTMEIFG